MELSQILVVTLLKLPSLWYLNFNPGFSHVLFDADPYENHSCLSTCLVLKFFMQSHLNVILVGSTSSLAHQPAPFFYLTLIQSQLFSLSLLPQLF
jgi:hypothetical protein